MVLSPFQICLKKSSGCVPGTACACTPRGCRICFARQTVQSALLPVQPKARHFPASNMLFLLGWRGGCYLMEEVMPVTTLPVVIPLSIFHTLATPLDMRRITMAYITLRHQP